MKQLILWASLVGALGCGTSQDGSERSGVAGSIATTLAG
jgi:hypothetical protein